MTEKELNNSKEILSNLASIFDNIDNINDKNIQQSIDDIKVKVKQYKKNDENYIDNKKNN